MPTSPIFAKTHDLICWLVPRTLKFPREHRFVLASWTREAALNFQRALLRAATVPDSRQVVAHLCDADAWLAELRAHLRVCVDLKLLDVNGYEHAAGLTAEAGRLLGGWRKSVTQKTA